MKRNSHPVKVVEVKDYEGLYANSHPFKVEIEGGGGGGETYSDFTGATDISAGDHGLVPAPKAGDNHKYLKGDGTWGTVQGGIPTNATFFGVSYDPATNRVQVPSLTRLTFTNWSNMGFDIYPYGDSSSANGHFRITNDGFGFLRNYNFVANFDSSSSLINSVLRMSTGTAGTEFGRRITNLGNPTTIYDATNKNYVDNLAISYAALNGSAAPTTATEGKYIGQLYYDTTNEDMYFLKAIDTTTTPATYTWEALGGGSSGIVDLNYSEYNPDERTTPTLSFGEWLYSKNLPAGTIVRMYNDTTYTYPQLFIGHTNDTSTDVFCSLDREPVAFLIYQNMKQMPGSGDGGYFKIINLGDSGGGLGGFDLWQWTGTRANPIQYFYVRHVLSDQNIKGTGEMGYSSTDVLSAESGNAASLIMLAATNISGLTKVDVEPLHLAVSGYKGTFTLNQTMEPWDWEWRGTAELDSSSPFDFSTAEVGSVLAVYIRDTNGVPLNYLNPYEQPYELTDTNGNTITVSGTLKDGGTAKIRIGHLILLQKYDDGWYFTSDGYDATYLPRTMEGVIPYTITEFNNIWENA